MARLFAKILPVILETLIKTVMFKKRTTVKICTKYAYLVFFYMFE
jgi:hypothetical protein